VVVRVGGMETEFFGPPPDLLSFAPSMDNGGGGTGNATGAAADAGATTGGGETGGTTADTGGSGGNPGAGLVEGARGPAFPYAWR
ncbi:hypothetical protein, partial [Streptomyces sp. NPDC002690]